jgi:hypothetical protein
MAVVDARAQINRSIRFSIARSRVRIVDRGAHTRVHVEPRPVDPSSSRNRRGPRIRPSTARVRLEGDLLTRPFRKSERLATGFVCSVSPRPVRGGGPGDAAMQAWHRIVSVRRGCTRAVGGARTNFAMPAQRTVDAMAP